MQLTKKAQTAVDTMEQLKETYQEEMDSGTEEMGSTELHNYIYACVNNIKTLNSAIALIEENYAQEEMDDFYLECHSNYERFIYTMQVALTNKYQEFVDLFEEADLFADFDYTQAENAGQEAREEGKSFKYAYTTYVLNYGIEVSKTRLTYDSQAYDANIFNASIIKFYTELLKEIA